ncbi:MAG: uroporphyrinogen decarboxylase family protein [Planctomycetaceae bacterium]|jgi:uroporphyrinogen decarboxylase|nr:uroporphyrinogen decarboxylase family protein [Planctomycetaceae bacterium]
MNGFERINSVLGGGKADVVPLMLHNFMSAAREAGMTMQQFRSRPENISRAFIEASLRYGLDGILTDVDTALEAYALGAKTIFDEDMPAKVVAPISDRIEEVTDKIDTDKLEKDERIKIYLDAIRMMREAVGGELFIRGNADQGAFSLATAVWGISNMMLNLANPAMEESILRLIERCYIVNLRFHTLLKEAGADMTSFGDSMGSPDLISPKMYQKFVMPFQKRLVADLTKSGIRTVCHICGNTNRILELMSGCGFAGVEIDYKTNVAEVQRIMYGKSVVFGIIDPSGVFCFGDELAVRTTTQNVLDCFRGYGLVLGAGCALPAETPPENIKTFVHTARNYRIPEKS